MIRFISDNSTLFPLPLPLFPKMSAPITCSVCLDDCTDKYFMTNCGHCFHHHCFEQWHSKSNTCPMCRGKVTNYVSLTASPKGPFEPNLYYQNRKDDGRPVKLNHKLYNKARKRLLNEDANPSHFILNNGVKMPLYRLYDEDDVGEIKTITLHLRMMIIFYQYAENIEMEKHEDVEGNIYYDAIRPIYESNMGDGQIIVAYEWIEQVMKVMGWKYDFKPEPIIYTLTFDLLFEVIEQFALEDKRHRFQTAICSAMFSAIKFYHWIDVNIEELIDITIFTSREDELESYNAYLNYYTRDHMCLIR